MTFKETLTTAAEAFESSISINNELKHIKSKLKACAVDRHFVISLIKPNQPMFIDNIGLNTQNNLYEMFVPKGIAPEKYRKLLVEAFKDWGFKDKDVELGHTLKHYGWIYKIILKW